MENKDTAAISEALRAALISPNESDSNGEAANIVDGLFAIVRAIEVLGAATPGPFAFLLLCFPAGLGPARTISRDLRKSRKRRHLRSRHVGSRK